MHGIAPTTEPGTGTQVVSAATEGDRFLAAGKNWHVGAEYFDTETGFLYELAEVVRKSSWCDTRPPEECPPRLHFVGGPRAGRLEIDPNDPSGEIQERFVRRQG